MLKGVRGETLGFPLEGHKLCQVEERAKAGPKPVAASLGYIVVLISHSAQCCPSLHRFRFTIQWSSGLPGAVWVWRTWRPDTSPLAARCALPCCVGPGMWGVALSRQKEPRSRLGLLLLPSAASAPLYRCPQPCVEQGGASLQARGHLAAEFWSSQAVSALSLYTPDKCDKQAIYILIEWNVPYSGNFRYILIR